MEITQSFRRGFATLLILDFINKALTAATVVVLIRGLSVSSYAYVTVLLTLAQLTASAAAGGISTRYLREEAERVSRGSRDSSDEHFREAFLKTSVLILVFGVCALPVVQALGLGTEFNGTLSLVAFATAFAAGSSAIALSVARYQARRRFFKAGRLNVFRALALLAGALVISLTTENELVIGSWVAASMVITGFVAVAGPLRKVLAVQGNQNLGLTREEIWLSFFSFASAGFAYVDVLVASVLLSEYEVATLGASLRYWAVIVSAMPALGAVLRVRTSQMDIVDSGERQRAMVLSWVRRTIIPGTLLIGGIFALAPILIPQIDGGKYPGSITAFQIFLATALIAYVTAPAGTVLMAQRRYDILGGVYALGLLINLIGDVAVARKFGVNGIALVSSIVYVGIALAVTVLSVRGAHAATNARPT
jgi:O-antigen/teichoic acid export membrane protein